MRQTQISRKTLLAFVLAPAVLLAGCGRTSEPAAPAAPDSKAAATTSTPAAAGDFKVALVTSGPVSDNGWNAGAYKALQAIKDQTGAQVQNVEAPKPDAQIKNMRAYASQKYNVVIGHGAEYEDIALKMEGDFPKTEFLISSGRKIGKNTTPIVFKLEDGAYLLGMVAASMSKTNKLGAVGAEKIVPLESIFRAFEAGAKAVKPTIEIIPAVYTGSWDDVAKAKQQTLALLDQGADVIVQDVDSAAAGVFDAVAERNKPDKPVYALGTNSDQNAVKPDVILASAPIYSDKAMVALVKQVQAGNYQPSDKPLGMKEGIVDFVYNPQLLAKIPADVKAKIEDAKKKILDGTLDTAKGTP